MQKINITIEGDDPETITLSLDEIQVTNMYLNSKVQIKTIAELEKKLDTSEKSLKYVSEIRDEVKKEIEHANVLLTALDVQEKTNHEQDWSRTTLSVSTRIALYIAKIHQNKQTGYL